MTEIYRGSSEYINLSVYVSNTPAQVDDDVSIVLTDVDTGMEYPAAIAEENELGRYRYLVPLSLTQTNKTLKAKWSFSINGEAGTQEDTIKVVTPYVTPDEFYEAYPDISKSYEEIRAAERRIRLVIESYCGQSFDKYHDTLKIKLNDPNRIMLPTRIISIDEDGITWNGQPYATYQCTIMPYSMVVPHTSDTFEMKFDGRLYRDGYAYITGWFGFETVPQQVKEAALLLINGLFCRDSIYRQKGITRVRAADWALDFGTHAFRGTGNVDADSLLSGYRLTGMAII